MLNSRQLRSWSTAMAAVPTILLALSTVASGNPVQSVGARQERNPVPMLYPGEMAICPACCSGPCMCIPNARYWGHFPRQWSPWPGDEHRADVRFPADRGIERIPSPQGELPKELPKEEYAPPETEPGPGVRIQEGPPSGPIPTTPLP
ncbi:MAG: hypothetical protein GXY83_15015, partial [Rhodopirellula sp.]|nr:hypothetical protein [Rhodopirellula sp.]